MCSSIDKTIWCWAVDCRLAARPLLKARVIPGIHAAHAHLVEFLVKRRLLIFDGSTSMLDCVVDDIVKLGQVIYRYLGRHENREPNTVVNRRNIDLRCWTKLAVKVIGQSPYPIFQPPRKWPELIDNDGVFAVVDSDRSFRAAEECSPECLLIFLHFLFVTTSSLRPLVYHCSEHFSENSIRQQLLIFGGKALMCENVSTHHGT